MRAVLTFHSVDSSGSVLSIAPEDLRGLVQEIQSGGHAIVPLRALLGDPGPPDRVALTFDDGYRSVWDEAVPVLRKAGAAATLFVTTGYLGVDNRWPSQPQESPTLPLMSWDQVRKIHGEGWAIEAHTVTHPDLRALTDAQIECEFRAANDAIKERVGVPPAVLAYPYGAFDARVESIARKHYDWAVTTQMGSLDSRAGGAHRVPRLETFYFRKRRPLGGFGSPGFRGYLAARAWLRRLRQP
jgi:peptidoglycan/xylan/chitin deacetylase (PgdA/CDA1 family)